MRDLSTPNEQFPAGPTSQRPVPAAVSAGTAWDDWEALRDAPGCDATAEIATGVVRANLEVSGSNSFKLTELRSLALATRVLAATMLPVERDWPRTAGSQTPVIGGRVRELGAFFRKLADIAPPYELSFPETFRRRSKARAWAPPLEVPPPRWPARFASKKKGE